MKSMKLGGVSGIALALLMAAPAIAQEDNNASGDTAETTTTRTLGTVTVTAQRREESLQDVGVAVEAYGQDELIRGGLESAQDLGQLSPALGVNAGGGPLTSIFVRGVGALTVNPLTDAAVAQNVDGVYLGRSSGLGGLALFDLERIELLKGPQGTLYGRNATGGVINYIPQKPIIGENSGFAQAEIGNFDKVGAQGAGNFALGDKAALRVSGNYLNREGYSDDGTNDADSFSLRGQLLLEPTDKLSIRIAGDYSENNAKGPGGDLIGTFSNTPGQLDVFTPSGIALDTGPSSDEANAVRNTVLHAPSFAFFPDIDGDNLFQDLSFTGIMAEIIYEVDGGTFTIIPAYRESEQDYAFAGPAFAPALTREENSQTSLEARFATDWDGAFNGIVGAFYIEEDITTSGTFNQAYTSPMQNYVNGGESWAVFADGSFDVSETFRITGGIRYTEDEKFVDGRQDTFVTFCGGTPGPDFRTPGASFANGCAIPGNIPAHPQVTDPDEFIAALVAQGAIAPGSTLADGTWEVIRTAGNPAHPLAVIANVSRFDGPLSSDLSFGEATYRIGAEWDWAPSNLLYATFATGYRAGGVDLGVGNPTYDSEFIDAITIGSKNRFFGDTLQVNAELFQWKYDGQQISYFTTVDSAATFPIANGDATIKGLDIDVIWAASDNTTISGNVQFLESVYDSLTLIADPGRGRFGCASVGVTPTGPGGIPQESYDCTGNDLLFSPEFGADLSINHIVNFSNYDLSLTADASHRGEQSTSFAFLDETVSDSYTTFNLDATLSPEDASWALSVFGRNVSDERYIKNSNVSNRGIFHAGYNPPATYGVRLRKDF